MTEAGLGAFSLQVDPESMTATLEPLREGSAQGDLYELSIRPFFRAGQVKVESVVPGATPGTVGVKIRFTHPFAAPADLTPPASATKRIDLHLFDVTAMLVADGTDSFFSGAETVTTNAGVLANADAYRAPGAAFDPAALGVTSATIFPYKLVAQNIDTGNPLGNYAPTLGGWSGGSLLAPTGYDVFPQGGSAVVQFDLDVTSGPVAVTLVTMGKYMDPRSTPSPKSKRLPVVGDPTALQYILPEAAGDVQRIAASVTGFLTGGTAMDTADLDLSILDWDFGATVATAFPNNANLGEISEASDATDVQISVPAVQSGPFLGAAVSGAAPLVNSGAMITNTDLYNPATAETIYGLIRVADSQDLDDATDTTKPIGLDETLAPIASLGSTRYQVIRIPIGPDTTTIPVPPTYAPGHWALRATAGIPYRLDLDSATTAATDPEGISQYRIDYDNNATWDATITAPDGSDLPDFVSAPAHVYAAAGPQTIKLEVTDGDTPASVATGTYTVTVSAPGSMTLDPAPAAGINSADGAATLQMVVGQAPDICQVQSNGEEYFAARRTGSSPNAWFVYRNTAPGAAWTAPGSQVPAFSGGLITYGSQHFGLGVLANGNP
ncbi:MAG: hypothetical protein ABI743_08470, partial [bacterium]